MATITTILGHMNNFSSYC